MLLGYCKGTCNSK